jgi:hypothetical protein
MLRFTPDSAGEIGDVGLAAGCGLALASAAVTELLGLHHILGAFLAGVAVPPPARRALLERLEAPVTVALMPFFFVLTGLRTTIDLGSARSWRRSCCRRSPPRPASWAARRRSPGESCRRRSG